MLGFAVCFCFLFGQVGCQSCERAKSPCKNGKTHDGYQGYGTNTFSVGPSCVCVRACPRVSLVAASFTRLPSDDNDPPHCHHPYPTPVWLDYWIVVMDGDIVHCRCWYPRVAKRDCQSVSWLIAEMPWIVVSAKTEKRDNRVLFRLLQRPRANPFNGSLCWCVPKRTKTVLAYRAENLHSDADTATRTLNVASSFFSCPVSMTMPFGT